MGGLPTGWELESASPGLPSGWELESGSGASSPDTFKARGVRQPDGTWLVQTPTGPVRLNDDGTPVEALHTPGGSGDVDALSEEGVLNRVLATAQGGAQGLVPQLAGLTAAAKGGDYAKARDDARDTVNKATEEAGIGYQIAGSVLSSGLAAPESMTARLGLSAGLGGLNAAAESGGDLEKTAEGAGIGLVGGGVGEALGYGVRKLGAKLWGSAADALANQTAKDAQAVEKEIASLTGELGAETQKGSRMLENMQRGASELPTGAGTSAAVGPQMQGQLAAALHTPGAQELAEKVAGSNLAKFPGQKAAIDRLEAELVTKQAGAAAEAAKRTSDYFATPLWQSEIAPRLRTLAPRFGLAATGAALGEGYGALTGSDSHEGAFVGAVLGAPGVRAMMKNIASSNRIKVAVAEKMVPLLITASQALRHGIVPTAALLSQATLHEDALGDTDLAAEQLAARGGFKALLGQHPPDVGHLTGINAPQTPLDAAIHRTAGVTALAGALDAHHTEMDRRVKAFLSDSKPGAPPPSREPHADVHELAANPQALVDRLANNLGSLTTVAPSVSASMAGVAQRAVQHLSTLSGAPAARGPLGKEWVPSSSEKRLVAHAAAIIDDPLLLLEHAQAGTLTRTHLDAAKAVYPTLARAIGDRALDAAIEKGDKLTHRQRLMLSLLAGVDVDGALAGTAANQRAVQAGSVKPSNAGAPGNVSKGGADKLTLGQRMAPDTRKGDNE